MNTIRAQIEVFHLLFLEQLALQLDASLYAVKGGCNLRFFFNSIRYSEDLDIDVQTIAVNTLQNKINRLLNARPFQQILKTHHIAIKQITLPKQTQTTQRWKLILQTPASLPIHTKIEFSRRDALIDTLYEPVDANLIQNYQLSPIFCSHHNHSIAFFQKIKALAGRPQTQARDVFDLFWLLHSNNCQRDPLPLENEHIHTAQDNALAISYDAFNSQVVAFLTLEHQQQYHSTTVWEQIVMTVIEKLQTLTS